MTREQRNELIEVFHFTRKRVDTDSAIEAVANAALMYASGEIGESSPMYGPLLALDLVAYAMKVSRIDLRDRRKWKPLNQQRWIAMWLLRQSVMPWRRLSFPEIAKALGMRNHTSVIHGVRKVESSPVLLAQAREILARVAGERKESA